MRGWVGVAMGNRGGRACGETEEVHLESIALIGGRVVRTRGQMSKSEAEAKHRKHS